MIVKLWFVIFTISKLIHLSICISSNDINTKIGEKGQEDDFLLRHLNSIILSLSVSTCFIIFLIYCSCCDLRNRVDSSEDLVDLDDSTYSSEGEGNGEKGDSLPLMVKYYPKSKMNREISAVQSVSRHPSTIGWSMSQHFQSLQKQNQQQLSQKFQPTPEVDMRGIRPQISLSPLLNREYQLSSNTGYYIPNVNQLSSSATLPTPNLSPGKTNSSSSILSPWNRLPYTGPTFSILGRIDYTLKYDVNTGVLMLILLRAYDLPAKDFSGTSDPYVKISLLPDWKSNEEKKLQSIMKRKTLDPIWNEKFVLGVYQLHKLRNKTILLEIFDYDRFSRDDVIGQVTQSLSEVDLNQLVTVGQNFSKEVQRSYKNEKDLGELRVSLTYQPNQSTVALGIIKAKQLKGLDWKGLSDPYVKVWLCHEGKKVEKRKTITIKNTLNPEYNTNFIFKVVHDQIRKTSLHISVMNRSIIGRNELIGEVLLGCKSCAQDAKHWNDMFDKPRQVIETWHTLKILEK